MKWLRQFLEMPLGLFLEMSLGPRQERSLWLHLKVIQHLLLERFLQQDAYALDLELKCLDITCSKHTDMVWVTKDSFRQTDEVS